MAYVSGGTLKTDTVNANLKKRDVNPKIIKMYADENKFLAFLHSLGSPRKVYNYKFEFMVEDIEGVSTTLASATAGSGTTLTVATGTGAYFSPDDSIVLDDSGTTTSYIVVSVSGDDLTVHTTVGTHSSGSTVIKTGKATEENGIIPNSISLQPDELYNYTQQFTESYQISFRQLEQAMHYNNKDEVRERDLMMKRFFRSINAAGYYGIRDSKTLNGSITTTTGGLKQFVTSNSLDFGTPSESTLVNFLKTITMKGSDKRVLFCGGNFVKLLYDWKLADRFIPNGGDNKMGFKTHILVNDFCELRIARDKIIDLIDPSIAFVVDPDAVKIAQLQKMQTSIDAADNGKLGIKKGILWDMGFEIANEEAMGLITNIPTS